MAVDAVQEHSAALQLRPVQRSQHHYLLHLKTL